MINSTPTPASAPIKRGRKDHRIDHIDPLAQRVWDTVSHSTFKNLWNFEGTPALVILKRSAKAFMDDDLLSRAAELGYYFLFALFPMLVCASAALGLAARGASGIYTSLLHYLAVVVPHTAYQLVITTFDQTAQASTRSKITLGLAVSLWSASVGFAAIQDGMNTVYRVRESRPYWKARGSAILVTILLGAIITLNLAVLFGGDFVARCARRHIWRHALRLTVVVGIHVLSVVIAWWLLLLLFGTIYYYAPDLKEKCWHWLSPGAAIAILGWLAASIGLRVYLHYFNSFSLTYGSLGAVIILMTWFYITGLSILTGAEINSQIEAAVVEKKLKEAGELPPEASTDREHPIVTRQ